METFLSIFAYINSFNPHRAYGIGVLLFTLTLIFWDIWRWSNFPRVTPLVSNGETVALEAMFFVRTSCSYRKGFESLKRSKEAEQIPELRSRSEAWIPGDAIQSFGVRGYAAVCQAHLWMRISCPPCQWELSEDVLCLLVSAPRTENLRPKPCST